MTRAVRLTCSEARKLLLSRTYLGAVAISVGLALFTVLVDAAVAGQKGQPRLGTPADVHQMLKLGAVATVAMLVVGILSSGGEFRHHTIISTLLTTPRRGTVVAAKATTVLLAGVALTTATFAVGIGTIYVVLASKNVGHLPGDTARIVLGSIVAATVFGLIGAALGFITRSTVAAVVVFVGWVVFGELAILATLFPHLEKWLPVGLAMSLTNLASMNATSSSLAPLTAGAVLSGYAVALLICAGAVMARRDVT